MRKLTRTAAALALLAALGSSDAQAQATATWYIGTYTNDILVWDEASEQTIDRITMTHHVPNRMQANASKTRLYVGEASGQTIEIVDLASREIVDAITLTEDSIRVRIDGYAPHPSDESVVLFVKRYIEHQDRFTVEGPFLLDYDLRTKQVTDTIPWPNGESLDRVNFQYSPDGETLYFFTNDIVAMDANSYEEVGRWALSQPLAPGLGRARLETASDTYDEVGIATNLFRMTDPVQNREMLGIARVRLADQDVDFFTLGTDEPVGQFALAPGGERAFALYDTVGRYEFWEFDLVGQRVVRRKQFEGRPRMDLRVSADGQKLYIFIAGNTIDVYDVDTLELLHSVTFDEDMRPSVVIPGRAPGS